MAVNLTEKASTRLLTTWVPQYHMIFSSNANTNINFDCWDYSVTWRRVSAVGLLRGLLIRHIFTKLWKPADLQRQGHKPLTNYVLAVNIALFFYFSFCGFESHHLLLSFSLGGWKLLLDINIRALQQKKEKLSSKLLHVTSVFSVLVNDFDASFWPHGVKVKHRWLKLCQLYASDAHCPDITQMVISTLLFHCSHLRGHPNKIKKHFH